MFILALKNLANNKLRLSLTALAIVLGVGFVVSSFVLRDGLKDSFANLSEEVVGQTDLAVTAADNQPNLTVANLETVKNLQDVSTADGSVVDDDNAIQAVLEDGTTIPVQGPPQISFSWTEKPNLQPTTLTDGRAPTKPKEWVIDVDAANIHGFKVGNTYDFITPAGKEAAELVGTFTFGSDNTTNGAILYAFSPDTLRRYLKLDDDYLSSIEILAERTASVEELAETVSVSLGNPANTDFEAYNLDNDVAVVVEDQERLISNNQEQFNVGIDIFGGILLGFALVSLFVSIFIIANTFSIVTSQRVRELGLLRAIGATPGQIRTSVLIESTLIGLLASLIGIGMGVALAVGLANMLDMMGIPLPPFDTSVSPTTTVLALAIGTGVTIMSALAPAFTASRTSPIAATSGTSVDADQSSRRHILGGVAAALGLALIVVGLLTTGDDVTAILTFLGFGSAVFFVGVTVLSPLAANRVCRTLGSPFGPLFKLPGQLATENAARNPRRTATTSAALMIGLSLVSMSLVVGESFKAELGRVPTSSIQADYIVTSSSTEVPDQVTNLLQDEPSLANVNPIRTGQVDLVSDGKPADRVSISTLDYSQTDGLLNFGLVEGSLNQIDGDGVALLEQKAEELELSMGNTISLNLLDSTTAEVEIVSIYEESQVAGELLVSPERFETAADITGASYIASKRAAGVSVADADAAFEKYAAEYPSLTFESAAEFRESLSNQIDTILNLFTALLGLALFIALMGISNTLALSVFERTREIGLLRAVGMSRRQLRRMIRLEATLISGLGAFLGAAIGIALGVVGVLAIPDSIISGLAIPWLQITVLVVAGSLAGLVAALFPAFRAGWLGVLDAIETR